MGNIKQPNSKMRTVLFFIFWVSFIVTALFYGRTKPKTDKAKFDKVITLIDSDTSKITLTKEQCLQLYLTGYMSGSFNQTRDGRFDLDTLLVEITANKRSIDQYYQLIK